jgi:diguanylate cyclase
MTDKGMNNEFDEVDFEYARTISDRANRFMLQHIVPPTPENFSVWFNYARGESTELKKTIDVLIANKRKFDSTVNRELYVTYIDPHSHPGTAGGLPEQLQGVISNAKEFLSAAIADNRIQIEALGEASSQFQTADDPQPVLQRLMEDLSDATTRASNLEGNFVKASEELNSISDSLKLAELHSKTDALTGLANRRSLAAFLRATQIAAMETGTPLSILMIDIDHFKKFNDNFGHPVGDQVLRLVAKVLQESVREGDLAARYGGEELIAVLPGTDLDQCTEIAERVRQRIADARLTRRATGEEISSITVSIGVAQFRLAESLEALVERCDRALYHAKRSGRNRTIPENIIESVVAAA